VFKVIDPEAPRRAADPNVAEWAEKLRTRTEELTPVETGRLAGSWRMDKLGIAEYRVSTDVEYAGYVEYGTRYMHGAAMMGRALAWARAAL
jgi:hypothetical protein